MESLEIGLLAAGELDVRAGALQRGQRIERRRIRVEPA
jgi:hypothetical protein